jgi:FKBP-type peptidyl-prolyl cis-trans isomerase
VANSRRRERELARRRYERRRLREQEQRVRRRRRNTIVGAGVAALLVIGGIVWLAIALSGGSDKKVSAADKVSASPTPSASETAPPAAPKKCAPIKPNPPAKGQPTVPDVKGTAPSKLVVKDVKTGHGAPAKKGADVSVTYIGASCSTGKVFDASYLHGGQPFDVKPLGQASVIQGWNQGLIGVKAGGVRELVIPASLGYGPQGQPPTIAPNETLIFLITVKSVTNS